MIAWNYLRDSPIVAFALTFSGHAYHTDIRSMCHADLLLPPSRAVLLHDDAAFEARCRQALLATQMHEQQHPLSPKVRIGVAEYAVHAPGRGCCIRSA